MIASRNESEFLYAFMSLTVFMEPNVILKVSSAICESCLASLQFAFLIIVKVFSSRSLHSPLSSLQTALRDDLCESG